MDVTIKDLEAYLSHQYKKRVPELGLTATEQSLFMKLVEETGEVAEVLNERAGRKTAASADLDVQLGKELADVIHYAVAIAAVNGFDLNEIILCKDKKASVKYNHDTNLEDFISAK